MNNIIRVMKTLIIQQQKTQKTQIISLMIPIIDNQIHFPQILRESLPSLLNKIIRIYDFISNQYVNLSKYSYKVPVHTLHPSDIILLKYSQDVAKHNSNISSSFNSSDLMEIKSEASSSKKERSKERIIFEVIEIVKKWRDIHLNKTAFKKVSLQEAAKMIGLPKKSLDDYYYQLRLGQKYDFDFKAHLYDRIGVLRTYLKNLKENPDMIKNQKHPKKLRILQEFQQIQQMFNANKNNYRSYNEQYGNHNQMQEEQFMIEEHQDQQPIKSQFMDEIQSKGIQDNFYNQFEYFLNEKDPFLACDYNFKKKTFEDASEQFFF